MTTHHETHVPCYRVINDRVEAAAHCFLDPLQRLSPHIQRISATVRQRLRPAESAWLVRPQELDEDATKLPDVCRARIGRHLHLLRRHVDLCAKPGMGFGAVVHHYEAEVPNEPSSVVVDQDVPGLQVAVRHPVRMNFPEADNLYREQS